MLDKNPSESLISWAKRELLQTALVAKIFGSYAITFFAFESFRVNLRCKQPGKSSPNR